MDVNAMAEEYDARHPPQGDDDEALNDDDDPDDDDDLEAWDDNDFTESLGLLEEAAGVFTVLLSKKYIKDDRMRGRLRAIEWDILQFLENFEPGADEKKG